MNIADSYTFQDAKLVLLSPWGRLGLVLALGIALIAFILTAWGYRHQPRRAIRYILVSLRVLSILALSMVVLQPAIQVRNVTRVPNHIAILLDLSQSMSFQEEHHNTNRLQRARDLLQHSKNKIAEWKKNRVVDFYSFGAALNPMDSWEKTSLQANEPSTQFQNALIDLKRRYRDQDLAAIILISDGIDNGQFGTGPLSSASWQFLQRLKVPIHTVWVGHHHIKDVALTEVYADSFAFARNLVQVEADLTLDGLAVDRIPVTLETNGMVVGKQEVKIKPGISRYHLRFEFVPPRVGQYVYTLSAPVFPGEVLKENNRRSFLLKVIRDRIRVLQVCGRPSWDERFLRQLLKRDPNVDLISFFILRTPTNLSLVSPNELSLIPFPTEELFDKELGSFDLVILQNFNYRPYGIGTYLPHLKRYVEAGGGLMMIGGDQSFTSGGYAGTPLAEVLPVRLLPEGSEHSRLIDTEDFKFHLTTEGNEHPILQLGSSRKESQQILALLPPLSGVNRIAGLMPGATTLAGHPSLRDDKGHPMPVLTVREVQKGRTMALTTDSSWYWAFLTVGAGGTRQPYDQFWRNTIRWLIQDPELNYLRVLPQGDVVRQGTTQKIVIRAYQPDYNPAKNLVVKYAITNLDGSSSMEREETTNPEGEIQLDYKAETVGSYRITARANIGGRQTTEESIFLVEPSSIEDRQPRATPNLLKQMANATKGSYWESATVLPDVTFNEPRTLHVNWRKDVELWSRWWSLLLCVMILSAEWLVRRKYGYL